MAVYVFALTGAPPGVGVLRGRKLVVVRSKGIHAICETRSAPPDRVDAELREQHALVVALADRVDAILPVRFGTLMTRPELAALLARHHDAIRASLEQVRDRVQMTVRVTGAASSPEPVPGPAPTGRAYLEARRRALEPPLPDAAGRLLEGLRPLIVDERRAAGAGQLLATLYHLVEKRNLTRYRRTAARLHAPDTVVTGPWPPFAFAPLLS